MKKLFIISLILFFTSCMKISDSTEISDTKDNCIVVVPEIYSIHKHTIDSVEYLVVYSGSGIAIIKHK